MEDPKSKIDAPASKKGSKESDSLLVQERLENKERRRNLVHPKDLCFKCHAKPTIAYRNGLVCCKECFKGAVVETHFRSVIRGFLEPSPKNPGKALVLVSGGPSSMSLAFMAAETANNKSNSKRKMFINVELLHIDESVFYGWNADLEPENRLKMHQFANDMQLKLHWVDLGEKYKLTVDSARDMLESAADRGSSREDIIVYLRNAAIEDFCIKQGISKLLIGDSALRVRSRLIQVASNTLATMIKGRGSWFESLAKETAEFLPGNKTLQVCRPLKEFVPKEIYYYLHSNGVTKYVFTRPNLTTQASKKVAKLPGMGNFTKVLDDFLNKLQKEYPSTIFTVLNTTEKVKVDLELLQGTLITGGKGDDGKIIKPLATDAGMDSITNSQCLMCRGRVDPSHALESGFDRLLVGNPDPQTVNLEHLQTQYLLDLTPFERSVCYGCKRIICGSADKNKIAEVFSVTQTP